MIIFLGQCLLPSCLLQVTPPVCHTMTTNVHTLSNSVLLLDPPTEGREEQPPIPPCWGMWRPSSSQDTWVRGPPVNTGKSPQPSDHPTVLLKTVGIKSNSLPWTPANISSIVACHLTSFLVGHADLLIHAELFSLQGTGTHGVFCLGLSTPVLPG